MSFVREEYSFQYASPHLGAVRNGEIFHLKELVDLRSFAIRNTCSTSVYVHTCLEFNLLILQKRTTFFHAPISLILTVFQLLYSLQCDDGNFSFLIWSTFFQHDLTKWLNFNFKKINPRILSDEEEDVVLMCLDVLQGNQLDVIKKRTSVLSGKTSLLLLLLLCTSFSFSNVFFFFLLPYR